MTLTAYRTRAGEITIDGDSYRVRGAIAGQSAVGSADERQSILDQPAIYTDFAGGMGASLWHVPGMYSWGRWVDTWSSPGMVLPSGELVEITDGWEPYALGTAATFELGNDLYICAGRIVHKCAGGTAALLTRAADLGGDIAARSAVNFKDAIYVGTSNLLTGAVGPLWKTTDGATWTSDPAVNRAYLANITWRPTGTPVNTLLGTTSAYQIRSVTGDPLVAANWGPTIDVGNSLRHIRSLVAAPRHVYIAKQEGVLDLDEYGNTPNLTPYWKDQFDVNNGAASVILEGYIYTSFQSGLVRVLLDGTRQDLPEMCGVGTGVSFSGPIIGRYTALAIWNDWLVAAVYNPGTNTSYIMFGQDRRVSGIAGPGPMLWHGAYGEVTGIVTHLRAHTPPTNDIVGPAYLWIGVTDNVGGQYHLYRQSLPRSGSAYQELLHSGAHRFRTSDVALYLADGWPDAPTARRAIWRYDVEAQRQVNSSIRVLANVDGADADLDGDPDWTEQMATNRNGRSTGIAPASMTSAARVQLQVELNGTATQPPVFLSLRVRADVNHELQDIRTYILDLRDGQETGADTAEVRAALARLRTLQRKVGRDAIRATVIDEFGARWQAMVVRAEWGEERRGPQDYAISPRISIRYLYRTIQYSVGDRYTEGHPYG